MKLWRYGQSVEYLGRRYRLDGMLGSGGMADVCLAWDEREQREVAVKVLKSDDLDQETLNRFMKEAAQIAHWQHPHILRVYESLQVELIDAASGAVLFYMVSEYARGGDLQKRLTAGRPFPLSATFALFRQLCDAVQYAHERGVIHRDLKPLNMLFRRPESGPEEVVLSDFGLAVQVDASHHTFARGGTLAYMAPEQFQGQAQPASDIFSLGVILYLLCTGNLPFRRALQDIPRVVQGQAPMPPRPTLLNSELPPALDAVMLQALRELPAERYRQPREFWEAIELVLTANAQTFPFSDFSVQNAGQTRPYDGSEQPQRSRQAGQQRQPPTASASLPSEEGPQAEEGLVSALWIAREKQKASPVRLPLPDDSILMAPNPSDDDGLEPLPDAHTASSTWEPEEIRRRTSRTSSAISSAPGEQTASGPASTRQLSSSPFETAPAPGTPAGGSVPGRVARPAASASGSTVLPFPAQTSRRDPEQTSRRQPPFAGSDYETSRRQPDQLFTETGRGLPRRASRQPTQSGPAGQSSRRNVAGQGNPGAFDASVYPDTLGRSAPGTARRVPSQDDLTSARRVTPLRPASASARSGRSGAQSRPRRLSLPVILAAAGVLILLLALFTAASLQGNILTFFGAPVTTVTIQPRSQLLTTSAPLTINTTGGQLTAGEIPGRVLTAASNPLTATANATGSIAAIRATGNLTFINDTAAPITIDTLTLSGTDGVQVSFFGPVTVPANPPSIVVRGFAVNPGAAGNIRALDISMACCAPGIVVKNDKFTGGQDAVKNGVIQAKDIDGAAQGLEASGKTEAETNVQKQVQATERAAGDEQCTPHVLSDHKAGDLAQQVTVQVTETCQETVYDENALRQYFTQALQSQASATPALGAAYALNGQVVVTQTSQTPASVTPLTLQFSAQGLWVYQFSAAVQRDLIMHIAGLSQEAANALLLRTPGIAGVRFSRSGALPVNTGEIHLVIQLPPSVHA